VVILMSRDEAAGAPRFTPTRRVKTPTVLQMEAVECGAAALGSILAYYGRIVPLEELRVACGVSRDGVRASNVIRAARSYGLEGRGFRRELDQLSDLPLPAIVFWNFNHFVVLEGLRRNRVFINDPVSGPRTVSAREFDEAFTGVVLTFEPGPEFIKAGRKPSLARALSSRLSHSWSALAYIALSGLMLVIIGLTIPIFAQIFVDNVLIRGQDLLTGLLLAMGVAAALRAILTWTQRYYLLRLETKLALVTSSKFFWHVLRLPMEFFNQRYSSEISSRVEINDRVAHLLSGELMSTAISLLLVVFYAALLFIYDPVLTLIGIAISLINILILRMVARRRTDANMKLIQERGKLIGTAINGLQIIETIKATGSEGDFFARWAGHQAKTLNAEHQLGLSSQLLTIVPPLLTMINTTAILFLGGLRVINGELTIGELVAFQALMAAFIGPFNQIVNMGKRFQEVEGNMNRLDDVFRYPVDPQVERMIPGDDRSDAQDLARKLSGQVELRNITFGYNRLEPPLIRDFNLTVRPGARVALVGTSASGKSTLVRLIAGLYEPWSGEILFDGQPRSAIRRRSTFTNSVVMVDQDIRMFEGTIRDNLTLWDPTVPETSIIRAAKDACIHADISERPDGYDYRISEGGRNFSGGQLQRMEIARALVNNPSLLILDEATSALDPYTEKLIDDNLRRRGCTCIIVAHRLSTIRDCDEIIVLEGGKVIQRGTHDDMKDSDGPYAALIRTEAHEEPAEAVSSERA
jgi:NHLM bacteriocin system ABC transporter peptidase/ATP-binding protein